MSSLPLWTEFLTHSCKNITFPQLRLRTVKVDGDRLTLNLVAQYRWNIFATGVEKSDSHPQDRHPGHFVFGYVTSIAYAFRLNSFDRPVKQL